MTRLYGLSRRALTAAAVSLTVFAVLSATVGKALGDGPSGSSLTPWLVLMLGLIVAILALVVVSRMDSALRERDQGLAEAQHLTRRLAEAQALARFGSWDRDLRTGRLRWSDELCAIAGYPPGFSPTFPQFLDTIHPEDLAQLSAEIAATQADSFSESEYRIVRPSGEIRHVHTRRFAQSGADGELIAMWGTCQDITDRKATELQLLQAREHAEAISAAMAEGYGLTIGGRIVTVNESLCEMTGFSRDELVGMTAPYAFWSPEHIAETERTRDRVVASDGGTFTMELMRKDGSRFDAELTAKAARNPDGSVLGFVTTFRDVSERNRHQAELERERRDLNEAQAVARIGSWDYPLGGDQPGRWSQGLWRMLGYPPRATAPSAAEFHQMIHPADRERVLAGIHQARATGIPWAGEFRMSAARGRTLVVAYRAEYARDETGRPIGVYGTIQDVTERAQREREEAAVREIAHQVASGESARSEVFEQVARQMLVLFDAQGAAVIRIDPLSGQGVMMSGLGAVSESSPETETGLSRTGDLIIAPVLVSGGVWGSLQLTLVPGTVTPDCAERLGRFAELVAMAIANAEAWAVLSRHASTDEITGLANRRTFQSRLETEIGCLRRGGGQLSLVLFDLDHFKRINDTHGHQAGDRVLAEVGRRLGAQAREGELIARIGGEEFAWLMPGTGRDGAIQAAERMRRVIESEPFGTVGRVTVSAGVCTAPDGADGDDLVRLADRALYWAKDGGRNATFFYTDEAHALLTAAARPSF